MTDIVIEVEKISKKYRLGINTGKSDTFVSQILSLVKSPIRNFTRLKNLSRFDSEDESIFWALQNVSFEVKKGEVLGIIGHNGAGKSTLLKILSRITDPSDGMISITGRVSSLLEVGTGFHPELTGRENIYMNGTILGMRKKEIDGKIDEIISFSGITRHIDTAVKFYSSGMKVRLGFSVAAHLEPEILIIDEVLAVGDVEFQKKCLGKMEAVAGNGRTVLFVSHSMASIRQLCTRSLVLKNGRVAFDGTVGDAINVYLSQNLSNNELKSYYKKPVIENNPIEITEGKILGGDMLDKNQFNADEDIFIQLKCNKNEMVPGIMGYLTIRNETDEIYIESDTYDYLPNALDQLEMGSHVLMLKIPARVLAKGRFKVYLNFASRFSLNGYTLDSPKDILQFEVYDTTTSRGRSRKAHTSTIVEWKKM